MAQLGSIYDDAPEGPRGPDLRHTVVVSRVELSRGPVEVDVPRVFEVDGRAVRRVHHPGDAGGRVPISAPADVPNGVTLRLRGAGGEAPSGGHPGDLYLTLDLRDLPVPAPSSVPQAAAIGWGAIAIAVALIVRLATC